MKSAVDRKANVALGLAACAVLAAGPVAGQTSGRVVWQYETGG